MNCTRIIVYVVLPRRIKRIDYDDWRSIMIPVLNWYTVPVRYLRNSTGFVFSVELLIDPVLIPEWYLGKIISTSKKSGVPITYQFDLGSTQGPIFIMHFLVGMVDCSTVYIMYRCEQYRRHIDERRLGGEFCNQKEGWTISNFKCWPWEIDQTLRVTAVQVKNFSWHN